MARGRRRGAAAGGPGRPRRRPRPARRATGGPCSPTPRRRRAAASLSAGDRWTPLQLPQRLGHAALGDERSTPGRAAVGASTAGRRSRSSSGVADGLGVGQASGEHERAGPLDQQPVANGIGGVGQPDRPLQQLGRDRRRSRGGLPGRPGQPGDGLGVARPRPAGQVLGHLQGRRAPEAASRWPASRCSATRTPAGMSSYRASRSRSWRNRRPSPSSSSDPGPDRLGQRRRQLQDRPAGGRRQLGQREARPQDAGRPAAPPGCRRAGG